MNHFGYSICCTVLGGNNWLLLKLESKSCSITILKSPLLHVCIFHFMGYKYSEWDGDFFYILGGIFPSRELCIFNVDS